MSHTRSSLRKIMTLAGIAVLVAATSSPVTANAAAACSTPWGSQPKTIPVERSTQFTGVRAGRHACFDRLVLDGASFGFVGYVDQVRADGSGEIVPVRGGGKLQIGASGSAGPDGVPRFVPRNRAELANVSGYSTFRQVAYAGEFEGMISLGLGVRARLPFRVFVLSEPGAQPRLVVDVAHRW